MVQHCPELNESERQDMYPTDLIYPVVFNFTDTDSPIEHFEELGYEGANYVDMSGSISPH